MKRNTIANDRQKVLKKLISVGYDSDKKILDLKIENLITKTEFTRNELLICIGIKEALLNRKLVSFLCASEIQEGE